MRRPPLPQVAGGQAELPPVPLDGQRFGLRKPLRLRLGMLRDSVQQELKVRGRELAEGETLHEVCRPDTQPETLVDVPPLFFSCHPHFELA